MMLAKCLDCSSHLFTLCNLKVELRRLHLMRLALTWSESTPANSHGAPHSRDATAWQRNLFWRKAYLKAYQEIYLHTDCFTYNIFGHENILSQQVHFINDDLTAESSHVLAFISKKQCNGTIVLTSTIISTHWFHSWNICILYLQTIVRCNTNDTSKSRATPTSRTRASSFSHIDMPLWNKHKLVKAKQIVLQQAVQ